MRDTYEKQTKDNQEEFAKIYEDKIKNLQTGLDQEKVSKAGREQEVREMITKVSALTSRNVELEGSNTSLQKRMAELQKEMDELAAHMRAQMAAKDAEVKNKDDQMDAMTKDYKVRRSYRVKLWSFSNNFVSRFSIFVLIIYKLFLRTFLNNKICNFCL